MIPYQSPMYRFCDIPEACSIQSFDSKKNQTREGRFSAHYIIQNNNMNSSHY